MDTFLNTFLLLILACSTYAQSNNTGPIIGIISIPSDVDGYPSDQWSYIPETSAKFLKSGGAQVVPIHYDLPTSDLVYLLSRVNGVLLPGGDSVFLDDKGELTPIAKSIQFIMDYILKQNAIGNYYPLWGTCQGFQVIAMILGRNWSILTNCTGSFRVVKNNIVNNNYKSKLFAGLPADLEEKMISTNMCFFAQHYKLDIEPFKKNLFLKSMLTPTSYAYDAAGVKHVSSFEAPDLPIYAIQFHPEVATFEWYLQHQADHGHDAVRLLHYFSDFFVGETQKNGNTFDGHQQYLIDNYSVSKLPSGLSSVFWFPAITHSKPTKDVY